jgi:hypothetical protein
VIARYATVGSQTRIVGWEIRCPHDPPHPLTREVRDAAPLEPPPPVAWGLFVEPADVLPDGTVAPVPDLVGERQPPRPGRPPTPDDFYRKVANVVRAAQANGRPVQKAVAHEFGVSERQAARYIRKARELDLIPPLESGRKET